MTERDQGGWCKRPRDGELTLATSISPHPIAPSYSLPTLSHHPSLHYDAHHSDHWPSRARLQPLLGKPPPPDLRPHQLELTPRPGAQDNGGTILAISSHAFAIVAGDTRQSEGYSIQTRYARKTFQLTENVVVAVVGFQADGTALVKRIKQRLEASRRLE